MLSVLQNQYHIPAEPVHQQAWYWPTKLEYSASSIRWTNIPFNIYITGDVIMNKKIRSIFIKHIQTAITTHFAQYLYNKPCHAQAHVFIVSFSFLCTWICARSCGQNPVRYWMMVTEVTFLRCPFPFQNGRRDLANYPDTWSVTLWLIYYFFYQLLWVFFSQRHHWLKILATQLVVQRYVYIENTEIIKAPITDLSRGESTDNQGSVSI